MGGVYMYFFHYSDIYLYPKWDVNNMEPSLIEHTTKSSQIKFKKKQKIRKKKNSSSNFKELVTRHQTLI